MPCGPTGPGDPAGPVAPTGPVAPAGPISPAGPAGPAGPVCDHEMAISFEPHCWVALSMILTVPAGGDRIGKPGLA
jgi:hypothetical protein